ncbi:hypothetical protein BU090_11450 [Staphylococcus warneri]|uniref:PH domain-containing protein n=1 Tax=Staphylococcus TaxID=1279 RepID=UPI00066C4802|nr:MULTISPECIES: PH domain-containing protein [Staphylococcus]MDH8826375.1 PH domain-containing protein [Staphylococcus capitis]MDH8925548.1 PH domain-containing protein [Staphylococcus capitis]MDH9838666.1 PH domain-containing protein [Staphylococcus capitis]MDS3983953.1 PH domain-containing protein [Staphylococcus capitis]MDS3997882.1 PH domain-containing protein [Staphylococcus capitis]
MENKKNIYHKLAPEIVSIWLKSTLISYLFFIIILLSLIIFFILKNLNSTYITAVFFVFIITTILFAIEILFVKYIKYNRYFYQLNDTSIYLKKEGWFFKKFIIIPQKKVYYVEILQGPLLKKQKIYKACLVTVAHTHEIEGIPYNMAQTIKSTIEKQ